MMAATHRILETGTNLLSQAVALHTSAQLCCNSHKNMAETITLRSQTWFGPDEMKLQRPERLRSRCSVLLDVFNPVARQEKTTTDEDEMRLRCRCCRMVSRRLHRSHNDLMKSPPEEPCLGRGKTRTHLCSCNLTNRCLKNSIYISLISRGGLNLPNSLAVCQRLTVTYC